MGQETKKQRKNENIDVDHRDFHSLDRRPSSQNKDSVSPFSVPKSERPAKKPLKSAKKMPQKKKHKPKPTRAQLAKEDILYDTKNFDIVDVESAARSDQKKKRKKPKIRVRAITIIVVSLIVFFITALIGIFVIFKVDTIEVVGDTVYSEADILSATGYQIGDNLFFLPISEVEEALPKSLPYIESANISRKMPSRINIEVIAATPSAVFTYNNNYVIVNGAGKILDIKSENSSELMQVTGVEIEEPVVTELVKIADESQDKAFYQILTQLDALGAQGDMTELDLSQINDITMMYQGRVKMELGAITKLEYKVRFGLTIVQDTNKILESEYGRLDLTLKTNDNQASFTQEYTSGIQQEYIANTEGDDVEFETTPFASNPGRGSDIPDTPYTGNVSAESDDTEHNSEADGTEENFTEEGGGV